jgi:hypothetical protein
MAMLQRTCSRCGTEFEAKTSRATYCTASCRALASRERHEKPTSNVFTMPGAKGSGTIRAAVLAELGGQQDGVSGRQALAIADRLDAGVSDTAWLPMSRRLDELLAQAAKLAAAAPGAEDGKPDPIEYLVERGEQRRLTVVGSPA